MEWNKKQPDLVAEIVLKRAEVGKIGRTLRTRLAFAQFKVSHGCEHLSIDAIEPRVEELHERVLASSIENHSDSSSDTENSEASYTKSKCFVRPSMGNFAVLSDTIHLKNRNKKYSSHRKRRSNLSINECGHFIYSWKRHCSSPPLGSSTLYQTQHHTLSSPVKPYRHNNFTTDFGPQLVLYTNSNYKNLRFGRCDPDIDDTGENLSLTYFNLRSSPPGTPRSFRQRATSSTDEEKSQGVSKKEANFLLSLATTPSPKISDKFRTMKSLPSPQTRIKPSSIASTPKGNFDVFSGGILPQTPTKPFEFSDFLNITPSPIQPVWPVAPRISEKINGKDRQ